MQLKFIVYAHEHLLVHAAEVHQGAVECQRVWLAQIACRVFRSNSITDSLLAGVERSASERGGPPGSGMSASVVAIVAALRAVRSFVAALRA